MIARSVAWAVMLLIRVIDQPASRIFDPDAEKEMAVARWYMITKHDDLRPRSSAECS
jgi:hypothetical protein